MNWEWQVGGERLEKNIITSKKCGSYYSIMWVVRDSEPYNLALFFLMNDDTTLFTNQLNTELGINTAGFALLSEVKGVKGYTAFHMKVQHNNVGWDWSTGWSTGQKALTSKAGASLVKLKSPKNFHTSAAFKVTLKTQHMPTPASFLLPASSLTPESSRNNWMK